MVAGHPLLYKWYGLAKIFLSFREEVPFLPDFPMKPSSYLTFVTCRSSVTELILNSETSLSALGNQFQETNSDNHSVMPTISTYSRQQSSRNRVSSKMVLLPPSSQLLLSSMRLLLPLSPQLLLPLSLPLSPQLSLPLSLSLPLTLSLPLSLLVEVASIRLA